MDEYIRTRMLLGDEAMQILQACHVAVFGVGGVGSYAAEALARSGIGALTIVDHDTVALSNLNRQLEATCETVGQSKVDAMASRIRSIAPDVKITPIFARYEAEARDVFFQEHYDYIIDAIDTVSAKLDLIQTAQARGIPILSALGTGNKLDPSFLTVTDISKTYNCPLARVMRKELKARGIYRLRVLFSPELARKPLPLEALPQGRRSLPGSVVWVPGCAGLMMAGDVIGELLRAKGVSL